MSYLCGFHELGATAPDVGINYRGGVRQMPLWAEEMLASYLSQAGLDRVLINSTMRTAEEQAAAMYNNYMAGKNIDYGAAGKRVMQQIALLPGQPASVIQAAMAAEIRTLGSQGQLVSYHCDTAPTWATAADLDPGSVGGVGSSTYNAFLSVLHGAKTRGELKELLSPDVGVGNRGYDPAIHVVFLQGTLQRAEAAAENALTGGVASSYEGDDAPAGIPMWAWVGGGALAVWAFFGRKRK